MKPKLLFIVNVDWFFVSHRLPIAINAIADGYEVHLACCFTDKANVLQKHGIILHPIPLSRSGTGPIEQLRTFLSIKSVLRKVEPDVVHAVTIKPILYGLTAARLLNIKNRVASISGLGSAFTTTGVVAKLRRAFIHQLYKFALGGGVRVIVQNLDDKELLHKIGALGKNKTTLIRGSGVNLNNYQVEPEPTGAPVVMLVARLLLDKGVIEFVEAAKLVREQGIEARFVMVGDIDSGNLNSCTQQQVQDWENSGIVECWGFRADINNVMAKANIVVLPSYREGLPKCLIEAAACGRAVVTTDVPGCRDAIEADQTGFLVPVRNSAALCQAVIKLINKPEQRKMMGEKGRMLALKHFDIDKVVAVHLSIYQELTTKPY